MFGGGYRKKQIYKIYAYHLMLTVVRAKNLFNTMKWHRWAQGQDKLASASSYTFLARIYREDGLRMRVVEGGEMKITRSELSLTEKHITLKDSQDFKLSSSKIRFVILIRQILYSRPLHSWSCLFQQPFTYSLHLYFLSRWVFLQNALKIV